MNEGDIVNININGMEQNGIIEKICSNAIIVKVLGYFVLLYEIKNEMFMRVL